MKSAIFEMSDSDLGNFSKEGVIKIGKVAVEAMKTTGKYNQVIEKLSEIAGVNIAKEDLDINDTGLYTTAVTSFVEEKMRPKLLAEGVIKQINNFNPRGNNAVKVPLRSALITASDLPDNGEVTYDTGTYSSTTITLGYKYASNRLTHEIIKFSNVDLIAEELGEIGSAIGRKVDTDIIAAFLAATTTANSNLTKLGGGTYATYDALVDGLNSHKQLYAEPDVILLNPSTTATIMKLDEFQGGSSLVGSLMFKGDDTTHFPIPRTILSMRIVESTNVGANDIYYIDTARNGYLVKAGGIETFDGRISGALAFEVIGALNYGVGIIQPAAIFRLQENA